MTPLTAWLVLIVCYFLPIAHVVFAPSVGSWRPVPGTNCPFGPRAGWLIVVLVAGPIGWLMFLRSHRRRRGPPDERPSD